MAASTITAVTATKAPKLKRAHMAPAASSPPSFGRWGRTPATMNMAAPPTMPSSTRSTSSRNSISGPLLLSLGCPQPFQPLRESGGWLWKLALALRRQFRLPLPPHDAHERDFPVQLSPHDGRIQRLHHGEGSAHHARASLDLLAVALERLG